MRSTFALAGILFVSCGAGLSFAGGKYVTIPPTTEGQPVNSIKLYSADPHGMVALKATNGLSAGMNQFLVKEKASSGGNFAQPGIQNGSVDTVPYFNSWFVTGTRNSVYTYSMVGHSPAAGATTGIDNQLIPVVTVLRFKGRVVFRFNPLAHNDPQGSDIDLITQSPLYDASTTYPGNGGSLPPDTGQIVDTTQRAEFANIRAADWHTPLNSPISSGTIWIQELEFQRGDWTFVVDQNNNPLFPVVNINTIIDNFQYILQHENPANSTVPIMITDFVAAFDPDSGGCCILGFHTAQLGIANPAGILVWAWATFLPQSNDPFGPGFADITDLSHEISELYNDPFVNTSVAPWVDGSVSFAQGNLECADVIEAMKPKDAIFPVPLMTTGGPYTYHPQNEALLAWFVRTPTAPVKGPGPGVYSWPNTNTLNHGHNPAGPCGQLPGCWVYGEGPGGFFFGPPY